MITKFLVVAVFTLVLKDAKTQTIDDVIPQNPVTIPSSPTTASKWEQLIPALQLIKANTKIKRERLHNVMHLIKLILAEEMENKEESEINYDGDIEKEETVNVIDEREEKEDDPFSIPIIDYESIVDERLRGIKEIIDDRNYMLNENEIECRQDENDMNKNRTADISNIVNKISSALNKLKEQNRPQPEIETPNLIPIFRSQEITNNVNSLKQSNSRQAEMNPISNFPAFTIPCQRASDILAETATFPLPKDVLCDNPTTNLKAIAKNTKLNLDNLPFKNIVPDSITCVDAEDSLAVLFKPKAISLMQVYGNLLKKITITVLVPYYVSKLPF
ncbi:uncharacterized protein LOC118279978 [Spodoptera frugiperda]|uniref:Uncharacterized protein LOC118279978 n=1 Tax=Spodoptera frugiperda TaxID=7108 RepID=A0A9R0DIP9_SPOFR|nr:uncharacterized protein LOC118279978 [Spodoptera frugiperda]